jgi:hypothetical protein
MTNPAHRDEVSGDPRNDKSWVEDEEPTRSSEQFWMRSVSFVGLHRVLLAIANFPKGLTPVELNSLIKSTKIYETRKGVSPAPTTLYHCRNTLLKLNAILRDGPRLVVNNQNDHVKRLLAQNAYGGEKLDKISRDAFAELVLQNPDCQRWFFNLFIPKGWSYDVRRFRLNGCSVIWSRTQNSKSRSSVVLRSTVNECMIHFKSASEINAVLYGLRYWARDELQLIDEFFRDNRGSIMYPILVEHSVETISEIVDEVISRCCDDEWTTLSVLDMVEFFGEQRRRPVGLVLDAVRKMAAQYSGQVVLIPTSRSFAALTAGLNKQRQELNLRSYLRDSHGRYISHIRIHKSIRNLEYA